MPVGGVKTDEPVACSATVTYHVSFTNDSNAALVTGVLSIQNGESSTQCTGSASARSQSRQPISKRPPVTHGMPCGRFARGSFKEFIRGVSMVVDVADAALTSRAALVIQKPSPTNAAPTT